MMRLVRKVQCGYMSIVRKYPNGLGNRMERFDEWAKTWNDPNITCYYDYFYKGEQPRFQCSIPDSQSAKDQLAQCASRFRPAIAQLHDKITFFEASFADDHLLSLQTSSLSLRQFLKECLSGQTRSDVHRMFLWFCSAVVLVSVSFYRGVLREDYKQQVVHLEPDESYYRYNPNALESQVRAYMNKINMLNEHSNQVLLQSKRKAVERIQKREEAKRKKQK